MKKILAWWPPLLFLVRIFYLLRKKFLQENKAVQATSAGGR
jgi:hypothetical protein